ncbi:serine/threonine-protein kinase [Krasilnikovia cinnamomea]|uniref:non-specific serine/threonine protein kinase n=1 Tax=Krasilnikovia cinnamomea TaxID=349313 RepID=A0A4V2G6G9_9ACTN|nr:serine/threonine-protein kinase [Krasilnikovia cinnamomea]RZU48656.1 serine/threonine-protein kinase [Krasilnikovia cinnamomea]
MSDDWPTAGTLLASRYRLTTRLETGGMAEIWRADDELLGRPVALKLPTNLTSTAAELLQLAWKEARAGARLSHPNVAAVHDYTEAIRPDGSLAPFVVMELLAGETLAARLDRAVLPWREAATVAAAVADALAAAHATGVVHRDIKPGNVMLTPTGVKILDFGISAATGEPDDDESGRTFGTPAYVSPERLDGRPAQPATDVYGLGVLLYEMVTGDPPYPVDTWEELDAARRHPPAPLPETLPAPLRELVRQCLAEDPAQRPGAGPVRDRLIALAPPRRGGAGSTGGGFAAGRAPARTVALTRPPRRRRPLRAALVGLAVAAGAGFVVLGAALRMDEPGPSAPPAVAAPPSPVPSATSPRARRSTPPPTPLDLDAALRRVDTAVRDGRAAGQIRPDVATDLANLLRPLAGAAAGDVADRVADLRRKVTQRASEGAIAADRAEILQSRLTDLARAARA